MVDLYQYKGNFDPIMLPGMTARVITASGVHNVVCLAVGPLPQYLKDFGALAAATWDPDNEDENLEMNKKELAHYRMRILDDIQLRFNNLAPTRQWRTAKTDFILPQFPQGAGDDFLKEYLFKASEFFVWEDDTPRFDFYSTLASLTSRVLFSGWRYRVSAIAQQGKIDIWVSGWPSGGQ